MSASRPAIAALGVAGVALGVGWWWRSAHHRDQERRDASAKAGGERIRDKGVRRGPSLDPDPELAAAVERDPATGAPVDRPPELDEPLGHDPVERPKTGHPIVSVFDEAIAGVEVEQVYLHEHAAAAALRREGPATSNPHDVEVLGLMPRPAPAAPTAATIPTNPPDPFKPPPANSGVPTKPPPSDPATVDSGLPKEVVRRYIRRSMEPISACYQHALAGHPLLEGTVQVTFTIGLDGRVSSSSGTGMDQTVATCVAEVVRGIQFPRPDGGGEVSVRYPFVFRNRP